MFSRFARIGSVITCAVGFGVLPELSAAEMVSINLLKPPLELNPAYISDGSSSRISIQVFEGLVAYVSGTGVSPALAERWEISEDLRLHSFKIRENAKWKRWH